MFPVMSPAWYKSRTLNQTQSIMDRQAKLTEKRPMTYEMTLRDRVQSAMFDAEQEAHFSTDALVDAIAALLEDTGSPAHMQVAKELRGE